MEGAEVTRHIITPPRHWGKGRTRVGGGGEVAASEPSTFAPVCQCQCMCVCVKGMDEKSCGLELIVA